jgi:hypothetical protein
LANRLAFVYLARRIPTENLIGPVAEAVPDRSPLVIVLERRAGKVTGLGPPAGRAFSEPQRNRHRTAGVSDDLRREG